MSFLSKEHRVDNLEDLYQLSKNLKTDIIENKLVLIRGIHSIGVEQFIDFAVRVSGKNNIEQSFVPWDFGILMELKEDPSSGNYLFSRERVPLHWDGAFHEVPHILVFNSLVNMKEGRTFFVDTERVIKDLSEEEVKKTFRAGNILFDS